MSKIRSETFLSGLENDIEEIINTASSFEKIPLKIFNLKPTADSWSVAECMEHLNSYCRYYLPEFEKAIQDFNQKNRKASTYFQSSFLGRYLVQSVHPRNITKKMKTPKQHNYSSSKLDDNLLQQFILNQKRLRQIIKDAQQIDLNKIKIKIEVFPLLKMRIGEFLLFMIIHQKRHLLQAQNVLKEVGYSIEKEIN